MTCIICKRRPLERERVETLLLKTCYETECVERAIRDLMKAAKERDHFERLLLETLNGIDKTLNGLLPADSRTAMEIVHKPADKARKDVSAP